MRNGEADQHLSPRADQMGTLPRLLPLPPWLRFPLALARHYGNVVGRPPFLLTGEEVLLHRCVCSCGCKASNKWTGSSWRAGSRSFSVFFVVYISAPFWSLAQPNRVIVTQDHALPRRA